MCMYHYFLSTLQQDSKSKQKILRDKREQLIKANLSQEIL